MSAARTLAALATAPPATAPLPDPVVRFARELLLLSRLPLAWIVPDPAELPDESLRFFTVDPAWLDALVAGMLASGADGVRLEQAQLDAVMTELRETILPDGSRVDPATPVTGLILRSALVSRWPQLQVAAFPDTPPASAPIDGLPRLPTLRLEQIGPGMLIALFLGVPGAVWLEEPHHGVQLGVDAGPGAGAPFVVHRRSDGAAVDVTLRDTPRRVIAVAPLAAALNVGQSSAKLAYELLRAPFRQRYGR